MTLLADQIGGSHFFFWLLVIVAVLAGIWLAVSLLGIRRGG